MSENLENIVKNISPERKRRFEYADQIGEYLYHLLDRKDLTQKDLAKKMDMKPSQLSRYMNGEANLNLETIARIELALDERIISICKTPRQEGARTVTVEIEEPHLQSKESGFKLYHIQEAESQYNSKPTSKDVPASRSSKSEDNVIRYA